jgi:DNA-binding Lrp family transcriptional regulator
LVRQVRGGIGLIDEEFRVLKAMNEIKGRLDIGEFAQLVGLSTESVREEIQALHKSGHVKSSGGGASITEKGRAVLKAQAVVPVGSEFNFYVSFGQAAGRSARSLKEFYEVAKTVDVASLEFHLYRGDFRNWVEAVPKDNALALELKKLEQAGKRGESLREAILESFEKYFGVEALS